MRLRREMRGLSREDLVPAVGAAPEQIRMFERGEASLNARNLHDLSVALDVPVSFFFEEEQPSHPTRSPEDESGGTIRLRSALRILLAVVELADRDCGIDDQHYQAAKSRARAALVNRRA
jgi:transcriptional regulator with XRE-family HTH domain